jgi:hypothetical protein
MDSTPAPDAAVKFNNTLWAGGTVMALLGSMLVAVGMLLGGIAVISAARQWVQHLEKPPTQTARSIFHQLQAATSAGAKAWQAGPMSDGDQRVEATSA